MSLGRAVPWASWDEWRMVGKWLLSRVAEDVHRGLERVRGQSHTAAGARRPAAHAPPWPASPPRPAALQVAAWRARGRVPLGVDITACLVQTQLADAAAAAPAVAHLGGAGCATTAAAAAAAAAAAEPGLRLQYAMALVRMVNGIADSAQRGRMAASVASLATAAGLPRLLVDLRHEATHNELPALPALRAGAEAALGWMGEQYWGRQQAHLAAALGRVEQLVQVRGAWGQGLGAVGMGAGVGG